VDLKYAKNGKEVSNAGTTQTKNLTVDWLPIKKIVHAIRMKIL